MKILWIVNVELPDIAKHFGRENVYAGWLNVMAGQLADTQDNKIYVAGVSPEEYSDVSVGNIAYYGFKGAGNKDCFVNLIRSINPDVIHVWGTEYYHIGPLKEALAEADAIDKTVVSIQGLVSECCRNFYDGVPMAVAAKPVRIGRIKMTSLRGESNEMKKRGETEKTFLRTVNHCIGRTEWDKNCVKAINPGIRYHYCSESLREPFYKGKWEVERSIRHTIFFSQTHLPLKGIHVMLKALAIIKKSVPDVKLNVLGYKPLSCESIRLRSYDKYLAKLIDSGDIEENINWLGILDENKMREQYLKANVFVCASSIENSSNSVGEAMLLGVPVVASDRGGMKSIIEDNKDGILYDFDNPMELAEAVLKVFSDDEYSADLGANAKMSAEQRYDREKNYNRLLAIYESMEANNSY